MDQDGHEMIGIPLLIDGTTSGTVSDADGMYTLVGEEAINAVILSTDWGGSIHFHPGSAKKVDLILLDDN